ncbi:fibronectin type III domain-containing protein [Candidatus Microgenomates bacterium]|nr:fibronectin type III domain-containing protein [Candidatus Microgenomates bacterium]
MRKEFKIPTLIAVVVLLVGLTVTAFATNFAQTLFTKASVTAEPKEVKISNLTDSSFSVSWITDEAVSGAVVYQSAGQGFSQPVLDDRVQGATPATDKFFVHHVSLRFLKPSTNYTFKIISGSKEYSDPKYTLITPVKSQDNVVTIPAYGVVEKRAGVPLENSIVYVTVNNSSLLSSLTKSSGSWLVSLNLARTPDLKSLLSFNSQGDPINIFVQGAKEGVAQAKTLTGNETPVPNITIGGNFDFTKEDQLAQEPTSTPTPTKVLAQEDQRDETFGNEKTTEATTSPKITIPSDEATLSDMRPTFEGTGQPGQVIQITVESENKYSASVVVGENGKWNWTPPADLAPGEHTVTMKVKDESGKEQAVSHTFLVLASGTSVTENATPSATFTPTPTLEPEITASPSPIPVSGDFTSTITLLLFSLALIIVSGTIFYSASFKK